MGAGDLTLPASEPEHPAERRLDSTADVVARSEEALNDGKDATVAKEFSSLISRGVSMIDAESSIAVFRKLKKLRAQSADESGVRPLREAFSFPQYAAGAWLVAACNVS